MSPGHASPASPPTPKLLPPQPWYRSVNQREVAPIAAYIGLETHGPVELVGRATLVCRNELHLVAALILSKIKSRLHESTTQSSSPEVGHDNHILDHCERAKVARKVLCNHYVDRPRRPPVHNAEMEATLRIVDDLLENESCSIALPVAPWGAVVEVGQNFVQRVEVVASRQADNHLGHD